MFTFARIFVRNVVAQEQIDAVLFLRVAERIPQISAHRLHNVIALGCPGGRFAIGLDAMNQLRSAILKINKSKLYNYLLKFCFLF